MTRSATASKMSMIGQRHFFPPFLIWSDTTSTTTTTTSCKCKTIICTTLIITASRA